jgi:biotin--protein ligase
MTVKLNVLVYDGPGVSSLQRSLIESLRGLLSSQYDVIPVDAKSIQTSPWEDSTGLFVMPGGADLKYLEALDSLGIYKIKNYVERGGSYLGICAGGYFASNRVEFEMGRPTYEVFGSRPLGFCPAVAIGSVTKGFEYDSEIGAEALKLKCPDGTFLYAYANGAPFFKLDDLQENQTSILYRYDGNQEAAVVECKVGKGIATVCGPHLEISPDYVSKTIEIFKKDSTKTSQLEKLVKMLPHLLQSDSKRKILFTNILSRLGLSVNPELEKVFDNYPIWIASTSSNILEQFKLDLESISSLKNEHGLVVKDSINEFIFALSGSGETCNITSTKLLFIHDTQQFELFDIEEYLKFRTKNSTNPLFGSLLFYTRVIGSTQTILDQNSLFSSILPTGAVFVASHQNQGRGTKILT